MTAVSTPLPTLQIHHPFEGSELTLINTRTSSKDAQIPQSEAKEPQVPRSKLRLAAIICALYLSLFLPALDQSIVATAIPTIALDLKSSRGYVWIGSAYLLATAAGGPIWCSLSDIFGRKPILLAAMTLFFLSSIFCAIANSMPMLVVGRALEGIAGGGLVQLVNITISDLFSVRDRSLYFGLLEVIWLVAGGLGPTLGGALTQLLSWRWCFWINLPISGAAFVLIFLFLDVHHPKTKLWNGLRTIDWFGSITIIASTALLFLGLDLGGVYFSWGSPQVICLIVFGVSVFGLFIFAETKAQRPLVPLGLFSTRSNIASLLVALFHGMVYLAQEYYMPLYFQSALGASPILSGVLVLPIILTEAIFGLVCGVIIHSTGRYLELTYVGCGLMTLGVGLCTALSATSPLSMIVAIEIVAGIGAGFLFLTPMIALHVFVSQEDTASATSTIGFVRSIAQALSLVLGGVVFQNSMDAQVPELLAQGVASSVTDLFSGGSAAANVNVVSMISDLVQKRAVADAFAASTRNMWVLYSCLSACAVVACLCIKEGVLKKEHVETKTGLRESESEKT